MTTPADRQLLSTADFWQDTPQSADIQATMSHHSRILQGLLRPMQSHALQTCRCSVRLTSTPPASCHPPERRKPRFHSARIGSFSGLMIAK